MLVSRGSIVVALLAILALTAAGSASAVVSGTPIEALDASQRLGTCSAEAPGETTCHFEADAGWGPAGVTGGVLGASGDGFEGTVEVVAYDHITHTPYWVYRCTITQDTSVCHWLPGYGPRWGPFVKGMVTVEATADGEGAWTAYLDKPTAFDALG